MPSICAITVGALLCTLPLPPPICTASLDAAAGEQGEQPGQQPQQRGTQLLAQLETEEIEDHGVLRSGCRASTGLQAQALEIVFEVGSHGRKAVAGVVGAVHMDHRAATDQTVDSTT